MRIHCWLLCLTLSTTAGSSGAATGSAATNPAATGAGGLVRTDQTAPMPTALELLDKFAAAQEPLKSFIAVEEFAGRRNGISPTADGDFGGTNEIRLEGSRVIERSWNWGPQGGTRASPKYTSSFTDGQRVLYYDQQPAPGKLVIMPESVGWLFRLDPIKRMAESMSGSFLSQGLGVIHPGDRRIDLKLRTAKDLRLRPKPELAGWEPSPCHVIEGETDTGHCTLWLDPAHGYHLAREVAERRPEHLGPNGQPCGENAVSTVEKVRFEMRDGLWLPVEISSRMESLYQGWRTLQTFHIKVVRFTLNPNHAALRSFVPDDVRDGTQVTLVGENRHTEATGVWRDGRAVDSAGTVLWTPESMAGMGTNKHPQTNSTPDPVTGPVENIIAAPGTSENRSLALSLLRKHAATQAELRAFVCVEEDELEMDSQTNVRPYSNMNGRTKKTMRTEYRTDGNRYSIKTWRWGNVRSATDYQPEDQGRYQRHLWDGKAVYHYSLSPNSDSKPVRARIWTSSSNLRVLTKTRSVAAQHPELDLFGRWYHRTVAILAGATRLSVRPRLEQVGKARCYVIDAVGPEANDTLWIDPEQGFNVVQATYSIKRDNLSASLERVTCKQVEGIWIPVEGYRHRNATGDRDNYCIETHHLKITQITLKPDANALGSFVPDDIPNGTPVIMNSDRGMLIPPSPQLPAWRDGCAVDRQGQILFDSGFRNALADKANAAGRR